MFLQSFSRRDVALVELVEGFAIVDHLRPRLATDRTIYQLTTVAPCCVPFLHGGQLTPIIIDCLMSMGVASFYCLGGQCGGKGKGTGAKAK